MELLQAAASVLGGRVERAMLGQEGPVREESEQEKLMRKVVASRMYVGFLFLFVGVRMRMSLSFPRADNHGGRVCEGG
eukprot:656899-Rhodomonas_salina.1